MEITIQSLGEPTAEYFKGGLCPLTGANLQLKYGNKWKKHVKKLEIPTKISDTEYTILVMHVDEQHWQTVKDENAIKQWIVDSFCLYANKTGWVYDKEKDVNEIKGR